MAFSILNKIRILSTLVLSLTCFSNQIFARTISLEINKESIISVSKNSISFQAVATNSISYKVSLSCFNQDLNYKKGSLRVLKSEFHVGASSLFSYDECLDMRRSMFNGTEKLLLSWDQDKFDDFISTSVNFHRVGN